MCVRRRAPDRLAEIDVIDCGGQLDVNVTWSRHPRVGQPQVVNSGYSTWSGNLLTNMMRGMRRVVRLMVIVLAFAGVRLFAQGEGRQGPPPTAKAIAPMDITGYWVSVVVEDWRYRMLPPFNVKDVRPGRGGGQLGVPLNAEARKIAEAWDPAKDAAAGEQCRSYGAANLMRMPGRIHVTWQNDQTLKLEADAGTQTRLFYFGAPQSQGGDWQGVSQASWDVIPGGRGGNVLSGALKVVTTKLRPGYLLRNGVPYSANAALTEYYDRVDEPSGNSYLVITTTVDDPAYLTQPYLTSTHFRKQADASGWNSTACAAR